MNDLLGVLALIVLVLLNGCFVAAEYALVSVRRTRIDQRAEEGSANAKLVQRVLGNLDLYIASVQLGVSMASVALGFIAAPVIGRIARPLLETVGFQGDRVIHNTSLALAFVLATTLHIIFGQFFPKSVALQRSERVSLAFTRPLVLFTAALRPVILGLNGLGALALRLFGFKAVSGHHTAHSEEEIRMIVNASSQEGVLEHDEKELVYNVFDLSDTFVRSIMTPRVDMIVSDASCTLRRALELYEEHGYSRVPVYTDTPDNIVGVVHTSDVLAHLHELDHLTLGDIARPAYYAPESMRVSDLLKTMRERKSHMSIVVDEFGGTAGLVTLEDVLEEIVGEIYDETDEEEDVGVEFVTEGVYLLDGSVGRDEVEELLGVELEGDDDDASEFDTLAGFITQHFGYIPHSGEHFEFEGWEFTVETADQRRVTRVRASRVRNIPLHNGGSEAAYES